MATGRADQLRRDRERLYDERAAKRVDAELAALVRSGVPSRSNPPLAEMIAGLGAGDRVFAGAIGVTQDVTCVTCNAFEVRVAALEAAVAAHEALQALHVTSNVTGVTHSDVPRSKGAARVAAYRARRKGAT